MTLTIYGTAAADNPMQRGYEYPLTEPEGQNFHPLFKPELTPMEMLAMGVFGGYYLNSALYSTEYPASWLVMAKLHSDRPDWSLNHHGTRAGQSLEVWRAKGWIDPRDPRGWFEWYCRYYRGRRLDTPWDKEDQRQIKRWVNFGPRHMTMLKLQVGKGGKTLSHAQALIQWSYSTEKVMGR